MHGWVDSEITAILFALVVIVVVSLAFAHQVTSKSNCKSKKSQRSRTDFEREEQVEAYYRSMLVTHSTCAICQNPTTRRCSRCKSTKYCSSQCQAVHWKEGHKNECQAPKVHNFHSLTNKSGNMCNGEESENSKSINSTIALNPISLGFFKSFNNKVNEEKKITPSELVNATNNDIATSRCILRPKTFLFPYKYFMKLFEWEGLDEPCGLINCGNSCFANVVLQCLTYTRPLTAYLLDGCHGENCRRNDWCFMCELQNHVYKVRHNQNPFSPLRILSRIRNISNHLGYGRQEDAHEFMRFAIDSMQSICLDEVGGEKVVDPITQETTLIHHIFGGHLQSQVKCMQCKHESNRYESMMDLAVEIYGLVESLENAIAQFTTIEMLDGENKYKCDRCDAYVKAQKQLTLYEAPNILTIALKRFQSGKFGKLNKRVTFPEVLDMSPYMSEKKKRVSLYRLYAVVVHVDMLNASFFGHYICYVKDSNGLWYKIDDNKVKEVEFEKVLVQRAYMLFYMRSEVRKEPLIEEQNSKSLASHLPSKITNSPTIKSQRSSIFPPAIGTLSVPTDYPEDDLYDKQLAQFNISEEETLYSQNGSQSLNDIMNEIIDKNVDKETKSDTKVIPTHINLYKEELPIAQSPSNSLTPSKKSMACDLTTKSCISETMDSNFSRNEKVGEPKILVQKKIPQESIDDSSSLYKVEDCDKMLPFSRENINYNVDPLQVSIQDYSSLSSSLDCSTSCNSSINFVKCERSSLNKATIWNDIESQRAKKQHIEDTSKRLQSSTISDRITPHIDTSNIEKTLKSKESNYSSPNDNSSESCEESARTCKSCQSSNNLSSSKDYHCFEQFVDSKKQDPGSLHRIHNAQNSPIEPRYKTKSLEEGFGREHRKEGSNPSNRCCCESYDPIAKEKSHVNDYNAAYGINAPTQTWIQNSCNDRNILVDEHNLKRYNLESSQEVNRVDCDLTKKIEMLKENSSTRNSHESQIIVDELPPLIIQPKKETSIKKTTRSGIEIYEESYDIRPIEDDIPYVIVESLPKESTSIECNDNQFLQQNNMPKQRREEYATEPQKNVKEDLYGENLSVCASNNKVSPNEVQSKIELFPSDTRLRKQALKPLFFSGFLNKSPRSGSKSSLSRNIDTNGNCSNSEEDIESVCCEGGESLLNRRITSTTIFKGGESDNQRSKCHTTNNYTHSNGRQMSKDLPLDIRKQNGFSIVI